MYSDVPLRWLSQMLITHCELKEESTGDCAEANAALRRANMGLKAWMSTLEAISSPWRSSQRSKRCSSEVLCVPKEVEIESTMETQDASLFESRADLNRHLETHSHSLKRLETGDLKV